MKAFMCALVLMVGSTAMAGSLEPQDIIVRIENPGYEVVNIKIRRIAAKDSNKLLCHTAHWFGEFYTAPREWDFDLDVEATGVNEFTAIVKPNALHNNTCKSSLVTGMDVHMRHIDSGREFTFGAYLYTQGNETVLMDVTCTLESGDQTYYHCPVNVLDRFVDENENVIDIALRTHI